MQAAIAQLLMAEAVLDDVEGMLDHGAYLRERSLHRLRQLPQGFRERLDDAALDRDVPGYIAILKFRPLVRPGVAGIAEDVFLFAVQQRRRLGDVGFIGGGALDRVHQPRGDLDPDVGLHPEVPLIAFLGLVHLRVAALLLVLGRGRSGDDRGVDNRPPAFAGAGSCRISKPRSSSIALTSSNSPLVKSCRSSQCRKCSTVVASGIGSRFSTIPAKPRSAWLS